MSLTFEEINALGQVLDTTWGKSSTPKFATHSFKSKIVNEDHITVTYTTVVTFNSQIAQHIALQEFEADAKKMTKVYLGECKKAYKEECGKSITFKVESASPSVEMVGMSAYNTTKTAYFKLSTLVSIE